ncbi:hypothetical protein [Actinocatenispora sera]|uniref:Uncharacterized protein n=1 Tax=Actinocatenispora sera TaxID=390989 RepID=A0A810LAN0_9ACTN|nr:hypothetical protein [Actinocatenispora sera]BCJ32317.1 hypothetical protein Asera_64250 [Actinocatenispora sera]
MQGAQLRRIGPEADRGEPVEHRGQLLAVHPYLLNRLGLVPGRRTGHPAERRCQLWTRELVGGQLEVRPMPTSSLVSTVGRRGDENAASVRPREFAATSNKGCALADMPPLVISDLFGLRPRTAERWATLASESWADYLNSLTVTSRDVASMKSNNSGRQRH